MKNFIRKHQSSRRLPNSFRNAAALAAFAPILATVSACAVDAGENADELSQTQGAIVIAGEESELVPLGTGFDTISLEERGDCVYRTEPEPVGGANAQKVVFYLRSVEGYKSLSESLNVSASASLKAGAGSASAKASFMKDLNVNEYSIYILVHAKVTNAHEQMRDVTLRPGFATLLDNGLNDVFHVRCGDEFVVGHSTGGELISILEIKTKSREEQQKISAQVSASYGMFDASASVNSAISKMVGSNETTIKMYRTGGQLDLYVTPEQLMQQVKDFPSSVAGDQGWNFQIETMAYSRLENYPLGANAIDLAAQKLVVTQLADHQFRIIELMNNINYIRANPEQFVEPDLTALGTVLNPLSEDLNDVIAAGSACLTNYHNCKLPEGLNNPAVLLPARIEQGECANPKYNEKTDPMCGVKRYNSGTDPVCGTLYNSGRGSECGVEKYKSGTGPVCGVGQYKLARHAKCPKEYSNVVSVICREVPGPVGEPRGMNCTYRLDGKSTTVRNVRSSMSGGGNACKNFGYLGWDGSRCYNAEPCRVPENGAEYNTCRHASFGVDTYKSCRHENFGFESYKTCENPKFGAAEYETCRKQEFGMESCLGPIQFVPWGTPVLPLP